MERRVATGFAALALSALASGCGGQESAYRNRLRPPAPIQVSVAITQRRVSVDPKRFGAGPVELIIANLTARARELKLATSGFGRGGGIEQTTGPINPGDTAGLKADLTTGSYDVTVAGVQPATLRVGRQRPSAQNELLQP